MNLENEVALQLPWMFRNTSLKKYYFEPVSCRRINVKREEENKLYIYCYISHFSELSNCIIFSDFTETCLQVEGRVFITKILKVPIS